MSTRMNWQRAKAVGRAQKTTAHFPNDDLGRRARRAYGAWSAKLTPKARRRLKAVTP